MVVPDKASAYKALQSHDARFDGQIFVAVKSTGIYCRPVCPARTPKFENCTFYSSAAAAQEAGYRPCLRCRPETAPQLASWRGTSNTVSRALALIEEGALDGEEHTIETLAERLGIGERQLRRLFLQHLGASPVAVAQTRRVLFAKQLIHDTDLPMTEVALASGFNSLRRFNEVFQNLFHRPPSALRRKASVVEQGVGTVLRLRYRPPYDWDAMLHFLEARAIPGVEVVANRVYHRVIELDNALGVIAVNHLPKRESLCVTIQFPTVKALPAIVNRVRRQFDLNVDICTIDEHLSRDPQLASLVGRRPGLRAPGGWDGFELAVRAVLGQQVSVSTARRLAGRLVEQHGAVLPLSISTYPGLTHAFPSAKRLAKASSFGLGMPAARLETLRSVTRAAAKDPEVFRSANSMDEAITSLRAIPGIGDWTAQYIALRALREVDAFPSSDVGLLRGAKKVMGSVLTARELQERAETWRPWRAYAAQHLWAADGDSDQPGPGKQGENGFSL
jgi:AraC family transcriptional regulator, regulatory protein of adaptative response / DNA-3-methyladenine glycosylase II